MIMHAPVCRFLDRKCASFFSSDEKYAVKARCMPDACMHSSFSMLVVFANQWRIVFRLSMPFRGFYYLDSPMCLVYTAIIREFAIVDPHVRTRAPRTNQIIVLVFRANLLTPSSP